MHLSAKEEQKLQDIFYFLRVENLVYTESLDDLEPSYPQTYHIVKAIPLPKLVQILDDQESK